ncbi:OsmC family protein [Natribacillus halophilus]|uniref:Peroxiredoxin, SACOL1771 subfamily n=1 Tax=Natribacillus halophilus TaxID=549003 RepID=A0A1G8LNB1_9BACI|nr:OsmC family protein [Natribacillus halophilus]SDI57211.1 peroxiredoxin, SACOL1771 subfamily [Natribacillus halophilus]
MADTKTNLKTVWSGGAKGSGSIKVNDLETNIAIPESLGGSGEGADPKEILLTSATACFIMTLTGMLEGRKIPVSSIDVDTESIKSKEEGFKIIHDTRITVSADATEAQIQSAHKTIEIADNKCEVGNMLRKADVQIKAEGNVSIEST